MPTPGREPQESRRRGPPSRGHAIVRPLICTVLIFQRRALLSAGLCEWIVAPLSWLAQQWTATSSRTAGACRSGRLTHGAARNEVSYLHVHPPGRAMRDAGSRRRTWPGGRRLEIGSWRSGLRSGRVVQDHARRGRSGRRWRSGRWLAASWRAVLSKCERRSA
jgi:hypothetical protein